MSDMERLSDKGGQSRESRDKQDRVYCDNCGAQMEERGCKLVCPRCHFFYSCSDHIYSPSRDQ